MAIDNDLDRLLPGVIEEPTNQHVDRLNQFLLGLSTRDYERVLQLLPDRLTRRHDPIVKTANVWARFVDEVAYNAVHDYTRPVAAADVLDLLTTVNSDVHRPRRTMSPERGVRLLRDVCTDWSLAGHRHFALAGLGLRQRDGEKERPERSRPPSTHCKICRRPRPIIVL